MDRDYYCSIRYCVNQHNMVYKIDGLPWATFGQLDSIKSTKNQKKGEAEKA